jgi:Fe-S oxidoreductase
MLSLPERIAFVLLVLLCGALAFQGFARIVKIVRRGRAADRSDGLAGRFAEAIVDVGLQRPVFKARPWVSVFHAFIFFGFSFYLLVNVNDLLEAFVGGWTTIGRGPLAGVFNLLADLLSVLVLTGMVALLVRRFVQRPKVLEFNKNVKIDPRVGGGGVRRDSLIVGLFILLHVGSRWLGTALHLAARGHGEAWLPTASLVSVPFRGLSPAALETGVHLCWWLAMGLIVVFLVYFPRSKHLHLMVAPLNLALERKTPRGLLDPVADPASPGARDLADLSWPQILDGWACIQCNRCQEVCPAHAAGTPLSPAALEINKRYFMNENAAALASGGAAAGLLDFATSVDAVWSCTTCYACVRVCPVGNEPMMDLVELRRGLVFDGETPDELAEVLRSLDEKGNSFGESPRKRARWAKKGLDFKVKNAAKEPVQYLWYVGDFASYNPDCQEISIKVAQILNAAGVDFGILYEKERSAGNDARRAGEEGLFEALAEQNVATLEGCEFDKIFTTDPHTYNALKNEYGPHGGKYEHIQHYSTLLLELIRDGKIPLNGGLGGRATYHDPCYLGRYNGGFEAPREVIRACGVELVEMPRNRENSFCCGAGGGRIWMKDHEDMRERPSENRIREALALGAIDYFVVACPKDLTMYRDAVKTSGNEGKIEVKDIADFVAEAMAPGASGAACHGDGIK